MIEFRAWWVIGICSLLLSACALHEDIEQITYQEPDPNNGTNNMQADMDAGLDMADMPVDPSDMAVDPSDMAADVDDMTELADMADMADMAEMADATVDMAADIGPDMPVTGMTCPDVDTTAIDSDCNVIAQTGCPVGAACGLTVIQSPPDIEFGLRCLSTDNTWTQQDGETCGVDRCVAGLFCLSSVSTCFKYCELATAIGCDPDEFCAPINDETSEIGVCRASCD